MSADEPNTAGVTERLRTTLTALGAEITEPEPGTFVVALPGEAKRGGAVSLIVGRHAIGVHAFVCRNPDENHEAVYRYLLQQNLRLYGVSFAIDHHGDIYLTGRMPHTAADDEPEVDRWLGAVARAADGCFNPVLRMGFESSIRAEYAWRIRRGESLANLAAFTDWLEATGGEDRRE